MANKFRLICILLVIISLASPISSWAGEDKYLFKGQACTQGLYHQPNGPFAVMLFCENALGKHIGVVYYDTLGVPIVDQWALSQRFWQDDIWATDVTSYAWGLDGSKLYVATSEIYGSGGLFELNLLAKEVVQIAPTDMRVSLINPGIGYTIVSIDSSAGKLNYSIVPWNAKEVTAEVISIPLSKK